MLTWRQAQAGWGCGLLPSPSELVLLVVCVLQVAIDMREE